MSTFSFLLILFYFYDNLNIYKTRHRLDVQNRIVFLDRDIRFYAISLYFELQLKVLFKTNCI